jgi:ribonuclease Z
VRDVRREAEAEFANTVVPRDFDVLDLPLPERGPPVLVRGDAAQAAPEPAPADAPPSG